MTAVASNPGIIARAADTVPLAVHGGRDHAELISLNIDPDDVIDFSTNSNPYGPPPAVIDACRAATTAEILAAYPDRDALALVNAIAADEGVEPSMILPGNGSAELIQLIGIGFVRPDSLHYIIGPTFGEYARALRLAGGRVMQYRPHAPDYQPDISAITADIQQWQPDSIWLCNPNNPTGCQWSQPELTRLQASAPDALWVIDEAYRHFSPRPVCALQPYANQIILRSLTKEFSLAGLRLGYAIGSPSLIDMLRMLQPPWSVNSIAQCAGVAALQPASLRWRAETLAAHRAEARDLWREVERLGYPVLPSELPFALIEVGDGARVRRQLLRQGILVRDATSFGLPGFIRVAARLRNENRLLLSALGFVFV